MAIFGKARREKEQYIDLSEHLDDTKVEGEPSLYVKVAELQRYEDLPDFIDYVYNGNLLLLDYSTLANDDIEKERIANELKKVVVDVGGDLAGLGRNIMIVAPAGVKIDRKKMRGSYF
jgi:SepF-like predicted cell division protein (DUF552 family)